MFIEHSECMGDCPSYSLRVDADGAVEYLGLRHVRFHGRRTAVLGAAAVAEIKAAFDAANFLDMSNLNYGIDDVAQVTLRYEDGTRKKEVRHPDGRDVTLTKSFRSGSFARSHEARSPPNAKLKDEVEALVPLELETTVAAGSAVATPRPAAFTVDLGQAMSDTVGTLAAATCVRHPDHLAAGNCNRCGAFFCEAERHVVEGKGYCGPCGRRDDVDWVEAYRRACWGKRDLWTWLVALDGALLTGSTIDLIRPYPSDAALWTWSIWVLFGFQVLGSAWTFAFFLGKAWSRAPLLIVWPLLGTLGVAFRGYWAAAIAGLVFLGIGTAVYQNGRNRLFFRLPLSEARLRRSWRGYVNNRLALLGAALSLIGFFFPPAALFALVFSAVALQRASPVAIPPVARRRTAMIGTIGAISSVVWFAHRLTHLP